MPIVKIEIVQTVEQIVEYTFEVPEGYTPPGDSADALDEIQDNPEAIYIGHDIVDESLISQQVPSVSVSE